MQPKTTLILVATVVLSLGNAATAAPKFAAYEGKNAVQEGDGGNKTTVEGVDFWIKGAPPRKFKVLGSLTDTRHASGVYGSIRMSGLDKDIAKAAKQAGGDAVIMVSSETEVVGNVATGSFQTNGNIGYGGGFNASSFGTSSSKAIKKNNSEYLVISYIVDPTPTPAP